MAIKSVTIDDATLKDFAADNGIVNLKYDSTSETTTTDMVTKQNSFGRDIYTIDSSKLSNKVNMSVDFTGNTNENGNEFIGGKGADTVYSGSADITATGGAGNDTFVISSETTNVNITDYTANQDVIALDGENPVIGGVTFHAKDVSFNVTYGEDKTSAITLKNGKNKLINITTKDGKTTLFSQSFQPTGDIEYNADDANTGDVLTTNAVYVNAENRKKALTINATSTEEGLEVVGGKGNDVISVAGTNQTTITTGAGIDTVVVNSGNNLYLDDFAFGAAKGDALKLADNLVFNKAEVSKDNEKNIILTFSDTTTSNAEAAQVEIANATWDQVSAADKYFVKVGQGTKATIEGTGTYKDESELYVTKFAKDNKTAIDLTSDTTIGDGFKVTDSVKKLVFTPATAVNVKAGRNKITQIVAGGGKDTLFGVDTEVNGESALELDGGKGNDLLYGNVSGAYLYGSDGNDTLNGGKAKSYLTGGAGNDTFLLTGQGNADIKDYNSGLAGQFGTEAKADVTARSKVLGADTIVVQYDKYAKTNNELSGRAELTGSSWDEDSGNLVLNVSGKSWIPTVKTQASVPETVLGHFDDSASNSNYVIAGLSDGDQIVVQEKGVKYTQFVSHDENVTTTANYHGLLNPNVRVIDGSKATKAMNIVAGTDTTAVLGGKGADTLYGNAKTILTGGEGNDLFVVTGGDTVVDYDGANGNKLGKDKIQVDDITSIKNVSINDNDVVLGGSVGGITITNGAKVDGNKKYQQITFQSVVEEPVADKTTGEYTSSKNVTETMIRTFSLDSANSVVSGGASTYLKVFAGDADSSVTVIKAGAKSTQVISAGDNVNSIVGGAGNETFDITQGANVDAITVQTGKGNDVINWDGTSNLVVTDYTATTFNATKGYAGDVIRVNGDKITQNDLSFDGNDVLITKDKATLRLTNMKDKVLYVTNDDDFDLAKDNNTISSANLHEYLIAKGADYDSKKIVTESGSETQVINATGAKNAADIQLNSEVYKAVANIYGSAKNDTINAYSATAISAGAGNDVVYVRGNVEVATGAGNDFLIATDTGIDAVVTDYTVADKFVLGDVKIKSVAAVKGSGSIITAAKANKPAVYGSDVTVTLSNNSTITLKNIAEGTKLAISADGTEGKLSYNLDYVSTSTTIATADVKGAVVDLTGAAATQVAVDKAASVSLTGAIDKTITVDSTSKKAVTYVGQTFDTANNKKFATVNFAGGNDVYVASGYKDVISLGAGNDTVKGESNRANIKSGEGNNVFFASAKGNSTIDAFSSNDKIYLEDSSTTITSITADDAKKTLTIKYEIVDKNQTGTINLTNYESDTKVTFAQLDESNPRKVAVKDLDEAHAYTSGDLLKLKDTDGSLVTFDGTSNGNVVTVDASARTAKKGISIIAKADTYASVFIGGKGADTLNAIAKAAETDEYGEISADGKEIKYTGGDGNDTFVINGSTYGTYTITDYKKGDILKASDAGMFKNIFSYSSAYRIVDKDIILNANGANIVLQGAADQAITVLDATEDAKATSIGVLADNVNVKLTKTDKLLDWDDSEDVDQDRVESFDASAATGAVTFRAINKNFTTFVGSTKGSTFTSDVYYDEESEREKGLDITLKGAKNTSDTVVLDTSNKADTITVNKAAKAITITNFDASDKIAGINVKTDIKSATVDGEKNSVDFSLKAGGTLSITGSGVSFKQDNFKKGTAKGGEDSDSGTTLFTFDKIVTVDGIGSYTYAIGTTAGYYEDAEAAQAGAEEDDNVRPFIEVDNLVNDFVQTDELSEITAPKVNVSADDLKNGLNAKTDNFDFKLTSNSDLTSNKKEQ